jgi:thiamine biosynthesis lipoprotein
MAGTHRFSAMGCEVAVHGASRSERDAVRRLFRARERLFSRFVPGSELNRVNSASGQPVAVSTTFAEMLALALEAEHQTGGLVSPTLGAELEAAGYDKDFAQIGDDARPLPVVDRRPRRVRLGGRSVLVSAGARIDLNGVVKGRTVDDALALIAGPGWVSAGGDLAVRGAFVVALPGGGTVSLLRGGMATSGSDRRRWLRDGRVQHHLIDPRTGVPAMSLWEQVTVCGASCLSADIAAKAAFLAGAAGPAWLDLRDIPGRFVTPAGRGYHNKAWARSLAQTA